MAKEAGISRSRASRIWRANDLKAHRGQWFRVSANPDFERKFWAVFGLYRNPPNRAWVLCRNEKIQCQALERTQPTLSLACGHAKAFIHDCKRNGTTTLVLREKRAREAEKACRLSFSQIFCA